MAQGWVFWVGVAGSLVFYSPTTQLWTLRTAISSIWATSDADSDSLLLGKVTLYRRHKRRIKTEENAMVVASVGGRMYAIPCCASCFAQDDCEEVDEFILFF